MSKPGRVNSLLESTVTGTLPGYQRPGGIDYAVGDRTTFDMKYYF